MTSYHDIVQHLGNYLPELLGFCIESYVVGVKDLVNMAVEGRLDFCCLQETRWRGEGARRMEAYKLFWMGSEKGIHGVGMLVADRWIEKVLEVKRVNERVMVVRVIMGRSVPNLISVYALQTGRSRMEKEEFLARLGEVVSGIDSGERLLICGDLNGQLMVLRVCMVALVSGSRMLRVR